VAANKVQMMHTSEKSAANVSEMFN